MKFQAGREEGGRGPSVVPHARNYGGFWVMGLW